MVLEPHQRRLQGAAVFTIQLLRLSDISEAQWRGGAPRRAAFTFLSKPTAEIRAAVVQEYPEGDSRDVGGANRKGEGADERYGHRF